MQHVYIRDILFSKYSRKTYSIVLQYTTSGRTQYNCQHPLLKETPRDSNGIHDHFVITHYSWMFPPRWHRHIPRYISVSLEVYKSIHMMISTYNHTTNKQLYDFLLLAKAVVMRYIICSQWIITHFKIYPTHFKNKLPKAILLPAVS